MRDSDTATGGRGSLRHPRASGTVLDPVCGMEIAQDQSVARATLDGWRHFDFCSRPCYEAFLDTPHAYAGWADRNPGRHAARRRPASPADLAWGSQPWGSRPR